MSARLVFQEAVWEMRANTRKEAGTIVKRPWRELSDGQRLSILLLCDDNPGHANTLLEHIGAFRSFSNHDVRTFNPRRLTGNKSLDLDEFDVVVIHYSLCIIVDHYLAPDFREKLRRFEGLKIQFIQDDYRWVDQMAAMMRYMDIRVLFTLIPTPEIPKVWDESRLPGVVKLNTLAGYVPASLAGIETPPIESRPIDIGYRGRILPYWVGRLGQEKVGIAQGVLARAERYGLRCDVAWTENERIYGRAWYEFISSCKAVLGTESGASITDFDGSVEKRVKEYLVEHPKADFEEVYREILYLYEGNIPMNVISPRIFEAIALRTPLILFPGEYGGIIQPWAHYIPLEKDFSNMEEVVQKFRNISFLRDMTERAYADVVVSGRHSLQTFMRQFDEVVAQYGRRRGKRLKVRYHLSQVERAFGAPSVFAAHLLGGTSLWRYAKLLLKGCIALRLIFTTRALRKILLRYLWHREGRREVRVDQALKDLLRLGILMQAQTGTLTADERFRVSVQFDVEESRLTFVSCRVDEPNLEVSQTPGPSGNGPDGKPCWCALESALREGRAKEIVWNHSAMGIDVPYHLTRSQCLHFALGQNGVYHFAALAKLAGRFPEQMWSALLPILEGEHQRGRRISELPLFLRFSRHPGNYVIKGSIALKLIFTTPELRKILLRYLWYREARREVRLAQVLEDLLKLRLLQYANAGKLPDLPGTRVAVFFQASEEMLVLRSIPRNRSESAGPDLAECGSFLRKNAPFKKMVWDHSAIASHILYPISRSRRLIIPLQPNGVYEFKALAAFVNYFPNDTWQALCSSVPVLVRGVGNGDLAR